MRKIFIFIAALVVTVQAHGQALSNFAQTNNAVDAAWLMLSSPGQGTNWLSRKISRADFVAPILSAAFNAAESNDQDVIDFLTTSIDVKQHGSTNLTNFANLAHAPGFLTNNGAGIFGWNTNAVSGTVAAPLLLTNDGSAGWISFFFNETILGSIFSPATGTSKAMFGEVEASLDWGTGQVKGDSFFVGGTNILDLIAAMKLTQVREIFNSTNLASFTVEDTDDFLSVVNTSGTVSIVTLPTFAPLGRVFTIQNFRFGDTRVFPGAGNTFNTGQTFRNLDNAGETTSFIRLRSDLWSVF